MALNRFLVAVLMSVFAVPAFGREAPLRVAFLNPATPANAFWEKLTDCMRSAAHDFGLQLEVSYLESEEVTSRFAYVDAAIHVAEQSRKPDFVIFVNLKDSGHRMLAALEQARIPSLIINSDIHPEDAPLVGLPRGKFRYWLGHLSPDDIQAGRVLAESLVRLGSEREAEPAMFAINGATNGTAATKREQGLQQALEGTPARLHYHVNSRTWRSEDGQQIASNLLQRYPDTSLIWAASDGLALGAREAAVKSNRKNILVGGIDWTDQGLEAVARGDLAVSVGGHVLEGIVALTLIYDYAHGMDFAQTIGTQINTAMMAADSGNIKILQKRLLASAIRDDDFKRLSFKASKGLNTYDFAIPTLLKISPASSRTFQ
ncbi:MAG: ABC transporter substrate-binding protein [Hahellaceae bacterium]|nr:ABC transporter substrate-binding protein [Hahellaceae bacterium]